MRLQRKLVCQGVNQFISVKPVKKIRIGENLLEHEKRPRSPNLLSLYCSARSLLFILLGGIVPQELYYPQLLGF